MSDPPADILRRLTPIPTYTDHPTTTPHDIVGVAPDGTPLHIDVVEAAAPALLLFLSAACLGCRDLWEGLRALRTGLDGAARLVVVTRDPGAGPRQESPEAITALKGILSETAKKSYAVSEKGNRITLLERLGYLYRLNEQFPQAVETYHQIGELDPDAASKAEAEVIDTYRAAHEFTKAEQEADAAVKKYPDDRVVRSVHAQLLAASLRRTRS